MKDHQLQNWILLLSQVKVLLFHEIFIFKKYFEIDNLLFNFFSGVEDLNRIRIDDLEDGTTGLNDENSANEDRTATVSTKRIITI